MYRIRRAIPFFTVAAVSSLLTATATVGVVRANGLAQGGHTYLIRPRDRVKIPALKWACVFSVTNTGAPDLFQCYPTDWGLKCNPEPTLWMLPQRATVWNARPRLVTSTSYVFDKRHHC